MKQKSGFTLIEVMIASVIIIIVIVVIYSTFSTADTTYMKESNVRGAQLQSQRMVDEIVGEAAESGRGMIWASALTVAPTNNPAGLQQALVYVSARATSGVNQGLVVTSGTGSMDWQACICVVPLVQPGQTNLYGLWRYELAEPTVAQLAASSVTVTVSATTVNVTFWDGGGIQIGAVLSVLRTAGILKLRQDMTRFTLSGYNAKGTATTSGTGLGQTVTIGGAGDTWGNVNNLQIMDIGVTIRAKMPKGRDFETGYNTTIRGRNN